MTYSTNRLSVACSALLLVAWAARPDPLEQVRSSQHTVAIYATVIDKAGHLVTDLSAQDFEIRDNGRPVTITVFDKSGGSIAIALLVDVGLPMHREFLNIRQGVRYFVNALSANDRLAIGSFGREMAISPLLTSDKGVLSRVIDEELWPGPGGWSVWPACRAAISRLSDVKGRRALVVVTDGRQRLRGALLGTPLGRLQAEIDRRRQEVEGRIREGEYLFYPVVVEGLFGSGGDLSEAAQESGGHQIDVHSRGDVTAGFGRLADELHSQYAIGFSPAALDGKRHRLEIVTKRPGLIVRARRSYFARP